MLRKDILKSPIFIISLIILGVWALMIIAVLLGWVD